MNGKVRENGADYEEASPERGGGPKGRRGSEIGENPSFGLNPPVYSGQKAHRSPAAPLSGGPLKNHKKITRSPLGKKRTGGFSILNGLTILINGLSVPGPRRSRAKGRKCLFRRGRPRKSSLRKGQTSSDAAGGSRRKPPNDPPGLPVCTPI